jgi:hypothetical protein
MTTSAAGQLQGRRGRLLLADPFELVDQIGDSSFEVTLLSIDAFDAGAGQERALAALCVPIPWRGITYGFVVLQSRSGPGLTQELLLEQPVECNVVGVTARSVQQGCPWGLHDWRGGLAAIGTLGLVSPIVTCAGFAPGCITPAFSAVAAVPSHSEIRKDDVTPKKISPELKVGFEVLPRLGLRPRPGPR